MAGKKFPRLIAFCQQHKRLVILLILILLGAGCIGVSRFISALWLSFYVLLFTPYDPALTTNLGLLLAFIGILIGAGALIVAIVATLVAYVAWQKPKSPEPENTSSSTLAPGTSSIPPFTGAPAIPSGSTSSASILSSVLSTPPLGSSHDLQAVQGVPVPVLSPIVSDIPSFASSGHDSSAAQIDPAVSVSAVLPDTPQPLPVPSPALLDTLSSTKPGNGLPVVQAEDVQSSPPVSSPTEVQTNHMPIFCPITALTDPKAFYGRVFEIIQIKKRLMNKESIPIYGNSLVGKTWLITYLKLTAFTASEFSNNSIVSFVDASLPSCQTIAGFTKSVLEGWGKTDLITDEHSLGLARVEAAIKYFTNTKPDAITPILCIDHFEKLNSPDFDETFFSQLRTFANNHHMVMVVLSQHVPKQYPQGQLALFYNVFGLPLKIKAFSLKEAEEFVYSKCDAANFTPTNRADMIKYIQSPEHRYPHRIQQRGRELYEDQAK